MISKLDNSKRTRFKLAVAALIIMGFIGVVCAFKGMEGACSSAILSLATVIGLYTKYESDKPSILTDNEDGSRPKD